MILPYFYVYSSGLVVNLIFFTTSNIYLKSVINLPIFWKFSSNIFFISRIWLIFANLSAVVLRYVPPFPQIIFKSFLGSANSAALPAISEALADTSYTFAETSFALEIASLALEIPKIN